MAVERSQIRVDSIEGNNLSPVNLSFGATCVSGSQFQSLGGFSVTGIMTAANFNGDGSSLSGLSVAQQGNVIALTYITG